MTKTKKMTPGEKARESKLKNEGLTHPEHKFVVYNTLKIYSKRKGHSKPTCSCCGYNDWKFLVFGHTTRKKPKAHVGKQGYTLALQLKDEGYPKTVTTLCHNCNTSQEVWGDKCPHKLSDKGAKILRKNKMPIGKRIK